MAYMVKMVPWFSFAGCHWRLVRQCVCSRALAGKLPVAPGNKTGKTAPRERSLTGALLGQSEDRGNGKRKRANAGLRSPLF